MRQYHVSVPVLAIAAGIILFLVALQTIMEQFGSSVPSPQQNPSPQSWFLWRGRRYYLHGTDTHPIS
jgi:small neutral amino acid transporter SnatA (MarC family)